MALHHHTQQRDDQGPSIPVLPTQGLGRHSPVHGVRASSNCFTAFLFDATPRCNRLGRIAKFRSSHRFKSTCARSLPSTHMARRAAGFPARYRPCPNSPDVCLLPRVGNLGAFVAAHFYLRLSQHVSRQSPDAAPSHLKRLSCVSAKRQQTTTDDWECDSQRTGFRHKRECVTCQ